jgi:putative lipoic acid-binding regulatory protein
MAFTYFSKSSFHEADNHGKERMKIGSKPKIEFPCDYPIKVVGQTTTDFVEDVLDVVSQHARQVSKTSVTVRSSRHGKYQSATLSIWATGELQLKALHADLVACPFVRLIF